MAERQDLEAESHVSNMRELLEGTGVAGFQHSSPEEIRDEQMRGLPSRGRLFESDERTKLDCLLGAADYVGKDQLHLALAEILSVLDIDPEHSLARKYEQELNALVRNEPSGEIPTQERAKRTGLAVTMITLAIVTLSAVVYAGGNF